MNLNFTQSVEDFSKNIEQVIAANVYMFYIDGKYYRWNREEAHSTDPDIILLKHTAIIKCKEIDPLVKALLEGFCQYKRIRQKYRKYKQYQRDTRVFIASTSCEMRTPITGIMGATQTLARHVDSPYLKTIMQCSLQLLETFNDVIDYCNLKNTEFQLVQAPFRLNRILEEVVNLARASVLPKPINVIIQDIDHITPLRYIGDASRVRQLIMNVVHNAAKFSPENGEVKIEISATESKTICIKVSDHGPGVAPSKRAYLFNPLKNSKGIGLGLVISRNLAQKNGL